MFFFANIKETNTWWTGLLNSSANSSGIQNSSERLKLFMTFSECFYMFSFWNFQSMQKKKGIRLKNKEKGFVKWRKEHPLKCLSFSYFWSLFSPPFSLQPEGTWFILCCVQYLHLVAANLQWHFFANGQGIRSTERCCPDSAKAAFFLCIWLCCHIVRQECTQINCFTVYLKDVNFNTLLSCFHDTFTSSF